MDKSQGKFGSLEAIDVRSGAAICTAAVGPEFCPPDGLPAIGLTVKYK